MRSGQLREIHGFIVFTKRFLAGASAFVGLTLKANADTVTLHAGKEMGAFISWNQQWAWLLIPGFLALVGVLEFFRRWIGNPRVWGIIHVALDELQDRLFGKADDELHEHRVTLFKRVRWKWCKRQRFWHGWLVPVERSGHTTQNTDIAFMAPDKADKVEGVVGKAWARRQPVFVNELPDLSGSPPDSAIREYAKKSHMNPAETKKRLPLARSLCACPVEVKGERWGVIVVDSRKEKINKAQFRKYYKLIARVLGKTLEGL